MNISEGRVGGPYIEALESHVQNSILFDDRRTRDTTRPQRDRPAAVRERVVEHRRLFCSSSNPLIVGHRHAERRPTCLRVSREDA